MNNIQNDSKYNDLNDTLSAIGKTVFVNFYYDFKDASIPNDALIKKLLRDNPKSFSPNQGFRIPRARHIFECGLQVEALNIIISSKRLEDSVIAKAKSILENESIINDRLVDKENEDKFIEKLNKTIVYGEQVSAYTYDNTPKLTKDTTSTSTITTYSRNKQVAMNALSIANYKCEYNDSHPLFNRKNSNISYTEPHHLVPLAASNDFNGLCLDREQNIVSLCSNCHNQLHYGQDVDSILKPIYEKRKSLLEAIGINISYDELKKYYK